MPRYTDTSTMTSPDQQWSIADLKLMDELEDRIDALKSKIAKLEILALADLDNSDEIYARIEDLMDELQLVTRERQNI